MAEIVQLANYRSQVLLRDGYAIWRQKFHGQYNANTCLKDLSAGTLCLLAEPGDESTDALYGMIIGFLGYGQTLFNDLNAKIQSRVIDIHLFVADHIRFEMMARLKWLMQYKGSHYPFFEMVRRWERIKAIDRQNPPMLSENHPDYPNYKNLIPHDQQVFIRRLLPAALEAFKKLVNGL